MKCEDCGHEVLSHNRAMMCEVGLCQCGWCDDDDEDNMITDDEIADCETPDAVWHEGGIKD